jgi:hypothetical protein
MTTKYDVIVIGARQSGWPLASRHAHTPHRKRACAYFAREFEAFGVMPPPLIRSLVFNVFTGGTNKKYNYTSRGIEQFE